MKIKVKLGVSSDTGSATLDLEDLGVTKEEWEQMNEDAQQECVQDAVNNIHEQPYWVADTFSVEE